jgi:glycosyltransferase involved in cell wall biosynthesis
MISLDQQLGSPLHICVCICTYKRARLLRRLLDALPIQKQANRPFTMSCVVVDNDVTRSAEPVVQAFLAENQFDVTYECQPERNFSVVRNHAVEKSSGDFIAFIDDDEVPVETWLAQLLETLHAHKCDAALGPVRPYYEDKAPRWLVKSGLCDRPALPTGTMLTWGQTRTGNVLLKRDIFFAGGIKFDPAFRTGGEDVDFFKRAQQAGRRFVWCEEAPAYELVPPERMRAAYYLRRALLQGGISLGYNLNSNRLIDRLKIAVKCSAAVLAYTLALPFAYLTGSHRAIRLLVKLCHHLGRLSMLLGCPIMKERKL